MKIRRALALAAATAVIAPAALLAAPAAYADDHTTTTTTAGGTGTPEDPADPADPLPEDPQPEDPQPEDPKPEDPADPKPEDPADPGEDEEDPSCEEVTVDVNLSGFPNKIVAGSGWKQFKLNVKNTGETDIEELEAFAFATYENDYPTDNHTLVEKYAHFEMKDPESGKWNSDFVPEGVNNGFFDGYFALDAGQSVSIDLRVKIDKGAPAGAALAIVAGGDINEGEDASECAFDAEIYEFQVVAAGTEPGDVEDSKPSDEKPKPDVKPQGDAKEIPVTGNLAETGSDSNLPIIGAIGGIAIVAGAGVVFAMKRRRSSDATA